MLFSDNLEKLIEGFSRFPGIGRKTAQRLAWHLIAEDKSFASSLAESITMVAESFRPCSRCLMLSESDPCPICASQTRDESQICIVEHSADVLIIERMNDYNGLYFVLGHLLSPIDGFGPKEIHAELLIKMVEKLSPQEIILALKPSSEGEATMHYISEILQNKPCKITRLSIGLPFGGDLEYSSNNTLRNAWARRHSV